MTSTSEAKIAANRENAKLSTGPSSAGGRARVRLNAVKQGFSSHTTVIPEHEAKAFLAHFEAFKTEYRPVGPTEQFMVQSLAEISWSAQQIRAESNTFMTLIGGRSTPVSNTPDPALNHNLAQADLLGTYIAKINLLGIYEQRKMRLFNSTRKELLQIQAERKAAENEELEAAAAVREACKSTRQLGQPAWQPSDDGFVCSIEQIDRFIARRDRLKSIAAHLKMAS
jgi:hypothetical protein